jgi:hypothetical protein
MREAWKDLQLGDGGLQSVNLRLARLLKKRRTAWLLACAFPLGLHHDYLADPLGAWSLRVVALLGAGALWHGRFTAAIALGAVLLAWALVDVQWIEPRLVKMNRQLRMQVYLGPGGGAPAGFRGHYTDDEPAPNGVANDTGRVPSFAEQERLLRELARKRPDLPQ